jgi:hypothetical protein
MGWNEARDFLLSEMSSGVDLPVEYDIKFTSGPNVGKVYRVMVLTPPRVETLTEIRKRTGLDKYGSQSINFAPTGACACCGR